MIFDLATAIHGASAEVLSLDSHGNVQVGGLLATDLARPLGAVTVDSRTVEPGGLFVAMAGERTDGHAHVGRAFAAGARACIVSRNRERADLESMLRDTPTPAGDPHERRYLLLVDDPLSALQRVATCWRGRSQAEVVGITGSLGKTTTKEIVASLLSPYRTVLKTEANLNTEIGLPLTLLRLRGQHEVAVLEMGMYSLGEIDTLARIASPRIGIVTTVAPIHLTRLGSIERIARAKSELVAALPSDGLAILNGDNRWTRAMATFSGLCRSVLVGFAEDCDYRATDVTSEELNGFTFTLHAEGHSFDARSPLPGTHLVHAILSAVALGRELGLQWDQILSALQQVRIEGRQQMVPGPDGVTIIDDAYNAAPESMVAALDLLRATSGERIAVLGDMLELGADEEAAHRLVGVHAADIVDGLVVCGPRAAWIASAAAEAGLPEDRIVRTMNNKEAAAAAMSLLRVPVSPSGNSAAPARSVLVKGSRGMVMEEVVADLRGRA